ncbi:NADH-quinone oxidoreductase subunit NuoH [candidate division KSB1 bacterium]
MLERVYYNKFIELLDFIFGPEVLEASPNFFFILASVIAALALFTLIAVFSLVAIYAERKISAHIHDRLGPMETGWHGLLQTPADMIKLLLKEDIVPAAVDKKLYAIAPFVVIMAALAVFVVFPFDAGLVVSHLNIGIVYIVAISTLAVPGILMAGWSSNNKWSLFGAVRSAAQIVSYEIPAGLAIVCVIMIAGTLNLQEIVEQQEGGLLNWFIFKSFPFNFIAFFIYFLASLAEINRTPFDMPEAESELVAGFMTEYSGLRWGMFFLAEYGNMLAVCMIITTLFLGGWQPPLNMLGFIPGWIWFIGKSMFIVFVHIWLRFTLPRLRVDQLMYVCWKVLTPIALFCIFFIGLWQVLSN